MCSIRNTAWLILRQGCCSCVCATAWDGKSPPGDLKLCFLGLQLNDAPLAIVDKRRSSHNVSEVMNLIGDVKDKVAVLVDDMIDTAGTITNAAKVSSYQHADAAPLTDLRHGCMTMQYLLCVGLFENSIIDHIYDRVQHEVSCFSK